jgi:hypothetical protein
VQRWDIRIRHGLTETLRGVFQPPTTEETPGTPAGDSVDAYLVLAVKRGERWAPMSSSFEAEEGDEAVLVVSNEQRETALAKLAALGWRVETTSRS